MEILSWLILLVRAVMSASVSMWGFPPEKRDHPVCDQLFSHTRVYRNLAMASAAWTYYALFNKSLIIPIFMDYPLV